MDPLISYSIWYLISVACLVVLGIWWVVVTRRTWLRPHLIVAMILFAALAIIWLWVALTSNEHVPDPSWTDYLGDLIGVLMLVPVRFLFPDSDYVSLPKVIFVLAGDSLFWGFISVLIFQMLRRYIQRKRFMPPDKSLPPIAADPASCD
jgi:hypothetical protein